MTLGQAYAPALASGADLVAQISAGVYGFIIKRCTIVGPANSNAFAYVGNQSPSGQFDSTRTGNLDTGEYNSPVQVQPGQSVWVVWPGQAAQAGGNYYATFTTDKLEV